MKRLRQLFMACAMLGSYAVAWAQTDVTDKIVNPNITGQTNNQALPNGWSSLYKVTGNWNCTQGTGDTQLEAWKGDGGLTFNYYQDIKVENGVYTVSAYCHDEGAQGGVLYAASGTNEVKVTMTGTNYTTITTPKITVTDGTIRIGIKCDPTTGGSWITGDNFRLTFYAIETLKDLLETANGYQTNSTDNDNNTAKAAFQTAIDKAQASYDSNKDSETDKLNDIKTTITELQSAYETFALSGAMPTEGHPFDITFKFKNPSFALSNADGWDCNPAPGFAMRAGNCEYYEKTFDISQTITNLPQAYYTLKVKAFQRPGKAEDVISTYVNAEDKADGTAGISAEIYVNSGSQKIKSIAYPMVTESPEKDRNDLEGTVNGTTYYVPNDMAAADRYFKEGYYDNEIELICTDGTAKAGFRCAESHDLYWTIFDDFRLYLSKPIDNEAFLKVYNNAIEEANKAIENHPDVKGKELAYLKALIEKDVPSTPSEIQAATTAIEEATATFIAAEAGWKRYAVATETATTAKVEFTDIATNNEKTATDATAAANDLFTLSLKYTLTAISTEDKTLGFDAGEWTIYLIQPSIDYVNTLLADNGSEINATKVAAADATAMKNAVTAIMGWTANEEEVNALANGNFANLNIESTGWTKTAGWANIRDNGAGNWWSVPGNSNITYGTSNDKAFKLSLKPNTVYYIDFKHSKWDSSNADNGGFVSVLNANNEGLQKTTYDPTDGTKSEHFLFKTGAEQSDYVLTIEIPSGRGTFTDFEIKKAKTEDVTIDETETYTPEAKLANVTLNRTFVEGWNGLVLPFDMTVDAAKTAFNASAVKDFTDITSGENGITLNFADATEIKAGKPVMIKIDNAPESNAYTVNNCWLPGTALTPVSKETGDVKITFTGTYAKENLAGKVFTLINGKYFYNYDGTETTVNAKTFRAYFLNETTGEAAAKSKVIGFNIDGETTGISEIKTGNENNGKMFDMQGRRVMTPAKGIYIKDGKKVIVK